MRDSFWASRTEGNPQMWQNIRSVAEALAADDLMLANAILEVSEPEPSLPLPAMLHFEYVQRL
jgi:hypothetical protein